MANVIYMSVKSAKELIEMQQNLGFIPQELSDDEIGQLLTEMTSKPLGRLY